MERTCCPSYTIRLRPSDFVPSKEQLRVSKRMERFLDGTLDVKREVESKEDAKTFNSSCSSVHHKDSHLKTRGSSLGDSEKNNKEEAIMHYLSDEINKVAHSCIESGDFPQDIELPKASVKKVSPAKRKLQVEGSEILIYSSNIAFQLAATLRKAKSAKKNVNEQEISRNDAEDNGLSPKSIAEKLSDSLKKVGENSGLSIKACNGHINFYSSAKEASVDESAAVAPAPKRSAIECKSEGCCLKKTAENPQRKKRKLEIRMKKSCFDPEEFALYRRYQMKVHNDTPADVTESSYRMFLVDTPLVFVPTSGDGTVPPCGFGSFHQQYVIDGQLVAVGVVDILPKCLSSKYLFWDPDFALLSPGKYSALQEIRWVKENQVHCPSLQYYYLGYYIHSCSKMRYKAAYRPSELLCPLRYQWVPFDIARPMLDRKAYVILSDFTNSANSESTPIPASENGMESQHDIVRDNSDDFLIYDYNEMIDPEFGSSDDESGSETSDLPSVEIIDGDVSNILIGFKGSHLRYEDLRHAFGPTERTYLESQLHRYKNVVGAELSERMVNSLG
ncbi:arginyl-tRNA--protein transferase 1-like isoform X2 [Tripterygium wilfordii]|nr:arginyl-tRNA--protein transferase 1-like isoform X2 [Tripterygium wilfordii]XP_038722866.1 arginyl-tRNA--protein transferase 1-like isoform X2 [Tripterygium wilfordii]XP_038722867.1 arginyl-tRNA--protein transferase 1-like isoform X2 [Tripterygium wilfordii]XP_038722868.1 arginyl-tRNA--protein transferase 1-like isoform X2 [Tripterygium wilfordii]